MIRQAIRADLEQVWQIYQQITFDVSQVNDPKYCAEKQKSGFIVSQDSKEDISKRIKDSYIFNVFEEEGVVKGLIDINKEIYFPEEAKNIFWMKPELKQSYFYDPQSTTLHLIVVNPKFQNQGIASQLFDHAITQLKKDSFTKLFAIVTTGPVTNCPSIVWHAQKGFERVCVTYPIDLFGLKGYSSLLFCRNI